MAVLGGIARQWQDDKVKAISACRNANMTLTDTFTLTDAATQNYRFGRCGPWGTRMTFPTVDMDPYLNGDDGDRSKVVKEIADACENKGYFFVVGHGVSEELIARTRQAAIDFFKQPEAEKRMVLNEVGRGFFPIEGDDLTDRMKAKLSNFLEAFVMGMPDVPDDPWYHGDKARFFYAANLYPKSPDGFRETVEAYFGALQDLSSKLVEAMAQALEMDRNGFADRIDRASCLLRLVRYPARSEPSSTTPGIAAHTDSGTLTILRGDDVPGTLQAELPELGWTDLRPPPGSFVCNSGDTMKRWSNGRWISPLHRVSSPHSDAEQQDRISLVFFHRPNYDVFLEWLARN